MFCFCCTFFWLSIRASSFHQPPAPDLFTASIGKLNDCESPQTFTSTISRQKRLGSPRASPTRPHLPNPASSPETIRRPVMYGPNSANDCHQPRLRTQQDKSFYITGRSAPKSSSNDRNFTQPPERQSRAPDSTWKRQRRRKIRRIRSPGAAAAICLRGPTRPRPKHWTNSGEHSRFGR